MFETAALILALQQHAPRATGNTSPASGDTVGYWQQRVTYTIVATLDEPAQRVRASGTMRYVNNSPDTLREMYVHQYLNAFRPHSRWSAIDEREGRDRFQRLRDPDFGYERFTAPVRVDGVAVRVDYPGAPDSTVAHFVLPSPLPPGDSLLVDFAWDARPSTLPRRQGRRGRHWDLAQWYPKVAVYDRAGWEPNALQPAGEFYGEYGTYDVTLVVAADQVIGASGVPVAGDPGWAGALRAGEIRAAGNAYGELPPPPTVFIPQGYKAVRFVARDIHHFAWSASPHYRYEGGVYVRPVLRGRVPAWDTVAVHALYQPEDDGTWGGLRVITRTINALRWLESVYGAYAYPQMTVLHRIEGGGTEFPMLLMNGSPSQGLILHEGGHVFTYGILGNNEWRSGWMDEGLTSYQTSWAEGNTAQEIARAAAAGDTARTRGVRGYRALALRAAVSPADALGLTETLADLEGRAQPIGTRAQDFRDFPTYNAMIYDRGELMYGQLRDVLGDSTFLAFLHDYYARWALRHVDERAMRASAERVSGRDLGWFFEQWVHRTGVMDYAVERVRRTRDASGRWVTDVEVGRRGTYGHPIAVGVRTQSGWTIARAIDPMAKRQTVRVITEEQPLDVRLDPLHTSWDWNRLNDFERGWLPGGFAAVVGRSRWNLDWPFLTQMDRDREVSLITPMAWYSRSGGGTFGLRVRTSYLGVLDRVEVGVAAATRASITSPSSEGLQMWLRVRDPLLGRPAMGWSGGLARLDGITKYDVGWQRTAGGLRGSRAIAVAATYTSRRAGGMFTPDIWTARRTADLSVGGAWRFGPPNRGHWFLAPSILAGTSDGQAYGKGELALGRLQPIGRSTRLGVRGYLGAQEFAPGQRALLLSAQDPVATFQNHWWRPAGAILKQRGVNWLPLGGAALRGYRWDFAAQLAAAGNADVAYELGVFRAAGGRDALLTVRAHAFADGAAIIAAGAPMGLSDAGVGLSLGGQLFDRPVFVRIDSPFYVSDPPFAIDRGRAGGRQIAPRWVITFNDIW